MNSEPSIRCTQFEAIEVNILCDSYQQGSGYDKYNQLTFGELCEGHSLDSEVYAGTALWWSQTRSPCSSGLPWICLL